MAINQIFSVRGATTVTQNSVSEITFKTLQLYNEIIEKNNLAQQCYRIINILATTTPDVTAFYPVRAIRESGAEDIPLFSCLEPSIDGALKMCIRLLVQVSSTSIVAVKPIHVYLHDAKQLRKDLQKD